jgi:hypothetical protein
MDTIHTRFTVKQMGPIATRILLDNPKQTQWDALGITIDLTSVGYKPTNMDIPELPVTY